MHGRLNGALLPDGTAVRAASILIEGSTVLVADAACALERPNPVTGE